MRYVAKFMCEDCHENLTDHQVMYSHGVCPKCGNSSGSTIVNHLTFSSEVEDGPSIKQEGFGILLGLAVSVLITFSCYRTYVILFG